MHTGTYYHIFDQRQYLSAPFSDINQCRHIANATPWTAQTQAAPLSPKPHCWEKCGLMTQARRPTCACCYLQHFVCPANPLPSLLSEELGHRMLRFVASGLPESSGDLEPIVGCASPLVLFANRKRNSCSGGIRAEHKKAPTVGNPWLQIANTPRTVSRSAPGTFTWPRGPGPRGRSRQPKTNFM